MLPVAQKCGLAAFAPLKVCSPAEHAYSIARLKADTANVLQYHQELYLGAQSRLKKFSDARIYDCGC